jgi:methionyl-tRNA formyltransferase
MVDAPALSAVEGLRVVFFGTPRFAVPTLQALLDSRHQVVGVVTQPDRPRGRGQKVTDGPVKALAVAQGLPVFQPASLREPGVSERLSEWRADLGAVAAYGQIIPTSILSLPRLGMINVHPSLLPKYRGAAPVHRAVIDGERQTGVTIMRVAPKLDAGAMFTTTVRDIGPDETSEQLEDALAVAGGRLLVEVADAMASGTAHETPQDDAHATYAARLTKEEGLIDWTLPAQRIHDRVRGLFPWPHAYTHVNGRRTIVWKTALQPDTTHAVPGTVVRSDGGGILVAAGDGRTLALLELQPENGRPMPAAAFLRGHPVPEGARFGGP